MRIPTAWHDNALLEDEPFCTRFHAFSMADTNRHNTSTIKQNLNLMASELGKDEDAAVKAWACFAFWPSPEGILDNVTRLIFVQVYWELYQQRGVCGSVDPVWLLLCTERHKLGFSYQLPRPPSTANREKVAHRHCPEKAIQISQRKTTEKKGMNGRGIKSQRRAGFEGSETEIHPKTSTKGATSGRVRRMTAPPVIKVQPSGTKETPCSEVAGRRHRMKKTLCSESPVTTDKQPPDYTLSVNALPSQNSSSVLPPVVSLPHQVDAPNIINIPSSIHSIGPAILINPLPKDAKPHYLQRNGPSQEVAIPFQKKPPLPDYPPIWAQSRQEVCESFDWFRSYQGGVYHVHDYVKGYLLSAFSSSRDLFEHGGRLIISHGGGKAESIHACRGKSSLRPAEDQRAEDKSVRALLTNYREARPLALLIDDKYTSFPYDIGAKDITYAVLGFYTIVHAWAEYQPAKSLQGRVVRYKFAFQWCEEQGVPWWLSYETGTVLVFFKRLDASQANNAITIASASSNDMLTQSASPHARPVKMKQKKLVGDMYDSIHFLCGFCKQMTPKVYEQAWVCLNPSCDHFWIMSDGGHLATNLDYNPDFLRLSASYLLPTKLKDLSSTLRVSIPGSIDTTYASTRGLHCRNCGRLSCRSKWERWECSHCKHAVVFHGNVRDAKEFWNEKLPVSFTDHFVHRHSGIHSEALKFFLYRSGMGQVQTFVLPNDRGRIHHIKPTGMGENVEADVIFKEYQLHAMAGELEFRRWPMRAASRGPLLTNYFSQNSGEPYHYVGGTANTVPFDQASSAVKKARDLIQTCIRFAIDKSSDFNEVLSAAYMERQRMAFHSDSEEGLGPLVAGLSLGSPAAMHFRMHSKYKKGTSVNQSPIVLSVILRHGDILVMDGAEIQEYYEHTVVPSNFRIAATARRIDTTPKTELPPLITGQSQRSVNSRI